MRRSRSQHSGTAAAPLGRTPEKIREAHGTWLRYLEQQVRGAQERGEIASGEEPEQLAFEIYAMLETADSMYQLNDDPQALERGRSGIKARLARAKIGA